MEEVTEMTAELEGLEECMAGLQEALDEVRASSGNAAMQGGLAYVADVKALAPVKTGQYRDGITCKPSGDNSVIVGSPDPFSRRLEYGFYDMTDSLGRHFFQEPRPHFRPPLDTEMDRYLAIMAGTIAKEAFGDDE
jgi:hypothetical protein